MSRCKQFDLPKERTAKLLKVRERTMEVYCARGETVFNADRLSLYSRIALGAMMIYIDSNFLGMLGSFHLSTP